MLWKGNLTKQTNFYFGYLLDFNTLSTSAWKQPCNQVTRVPSRSAIKNTKYKIWHGREQSEPTPGGMLDQRNQLNNNLGSGSRASQSPELPINSKCGAISLLHRKTICQRLCGTLHDLWGIVSPQLRSKSLVSFLVISKLRYLAHHDLLCRNPVAGVKVNNSLANLSEITTLVFATILMWLRSSPQHQPIVLRGKFPHE